jgi:uncharacterized membrane protein
MTEQADTILFQAVSTPHRSLTDRGMRWLCLLAVPGVGIPALLFTILGAWPVLGFAGLELAVVLGLLAAHRRWTARQVEMVLLTPEQLRVTASDGRGGRQEVTLEPYWARVEVADRAGTTPTVLLSSRGHSVEVGRFLSPAERQDLAEAIGGALRQYRSPRFDNPQLREG